jgi:replicative DNA helicase
MTDPYGVPPHSIEFEESLLAACLIYPDDRDDIVDSLNPTEFYRTAHQKIFKAIRRMVLTDIPVDLTTVSGYLKESGDLEDVGGASYLASLTNSPTPTKTEYYIKKTKEKAALRRTIEICNAAIKRCFDSENEAVETVDYLQRESLELNPTGNIDENLHEGKDLIIKSGDIYQARFDRKGTVTGVPTGYKVLDYITAGLQPTDLIVLAARPSMGKTALALNILRNAGVRGQVPLIVSLEQDKQQIIDRLVSADSGVNLQRFRTGKFERDDWNKMEEAKKRLYETDFYIDDSAILTLSDIRRLARKYKRQHGITLLIIDYLQLIKGPKSERKDLEVGEITRGLKALAKDLRLPVLCLSQLNRQLEQRSNPHKRPRLSDLRESGAIEQDADVVVFIYRPEVYNDLKNVQFQGQADIMVSKQRQGPTGICQLRLDLDTTRFYDIEQYITDGV